MKTEDELKKRRADLVKERDEYLINANLNLAALTARIAEIDETLSPAPVTQEAENASENTTA